MRHRPNPFLKKLSSAFWAVLCAFSLVLACGLKEPLHFLSHEASGTLSALDTQVSHEHSLPANDLTTGATNARLETNHEACLLKAFFEATAQNSVTFSEPLGFTQITEFASDIKFPSLTTPVSQLRTHWQSSRGPPRV